MSALTTVKASPAFSAEKAKLGQARMLVRMKAPYFSDSLLRLVTRESPGLGTYATTANMMLMVDYKAIGAWTPDENAFLIAHEIYHVIANHHPRALRIMAHFGLDAHLANIALDMCANVLVKNMGFTPPSNLAGWPEKYGYPEGLTAEDYAERLAKDKKAGKLPKPDPKAGKPGAGSGKCGSCAGHPADGEPSAADPDARAEGEIERLRQSTADAIRSHAKAKGAGSVPGDLLRWADAQLTPAKVRWQDRLARVTRRAVTFAAGKTDYRFDAPSKLQAGIGFGPGKAVLPRFRAPVPNVGVAVDTSASMGQAEGLAVLSEVDGILRTTASTVTFLACDTAVTGVKPVTTIRECMTMMRGGGGTDFRPIFAALEKAKNRPSVVIVCTDGDGPAPETAPSWCKVIWLLVGYGASVPYYLDGEGDRVPVTYGEAIIVPQDEI